MEHPVSEWLINSWAFILTLMLIVYAALDGFDLGIGILSLFERDKSRQIVMMESLSGVWDANETWLVLIGGTLFGAFPLAYAQMLQTLYIPVLLMLFGLIFRGVAFEFSLYARKQERWLSAFGFGSLLAALAQGMALGALLSGLPTSDTVSITELLCWATPFSLLTAALVASLYVLLGAGYLLTKAEGSLLESAYRWARRAVIALVLLLPGFFIYSAVLIPHMAERWIDEPLGFGALVFFMIAAVLMLLEALKKRENSKPFLWTLTILVLLAIALVAGHFPYLLPGTMTLHRAASSTGTLEFMLAAVGVLLPFILGYNAYQYYVFRGRTKPEHTAGV